MHMSNFFDVTVGAFVQGILDLVFGFLSTLFGGLSGIFGHRQY